MTAVSQAVQLLGSSLVLGGFVLSQVGRLDVRSARYLLVNLAGSGVLAADGWVEQQWGFVLLEGVWAVFSAAQLLPRRAAAAWPAR